MRESALDFAGQARRTYVTPTLAIYGNLVDLTATGSINAASESGGSPSDMQCTSAFKRHMDCP